MKSEARKHTDVDQIDMMTHPDKWPRWPYLPLIKNDSKSILDRRIGYLIADSTFTVHEGNIFMPDPNTSAVPYKTANEVLADGWVVD